MKLNNMYNIDPIQENFISFILFFIIIIVIVSLLYYFRYIVMLPSKECDYMNNLYPSIDGSIKSATISSYTDCSGNLRDYYIKTAFNACSGGSYKNDFVEICNLKSVLKQGARGIDLEIYSVGDEPVVSSSTQQDNFYVKETYNTVAFSQVIDVLRNYAFSISTAPNPDDPIFLHLRIKSNNQSIYSKMAALFKANDDLMLGNDYSFENYGRNLGDTPLSKLRGKIVIIVDKLNNTFLDNRDFLEYVNLTSNSIFMRAYQYSQVQNTPDINELQDYNRKNMTIVLPDVTDDANPANPSGILCREMGCQMVAMRFQLVDNFLEENTAFFDGAGYAFALKPERLRYVEVKIADPTPQDPALSYQTRTVVKDYYQFDF